VTYSNGGGTSIGGLANNTDYFVIDTGGDRIALAASRANALNGVAVDLTGAGSGTQSLSYNAVDLADNLLVIANHDLQTGQKVIYQTDTGNAVGGLAGSTTYYVIRVDDNLVRLATSRSNASAGAAIDLTALGTGVSHTLKSDNVVLLFDAARTEPTVNLVQNTIEWVNHGLTNGTHVTYSGGDGDPIGGLVSETEYVVLAADANHIRLANVNAPNVAIDLQAGATVGLGLHLISTLDGAKSLQFDPTAIPAVGSNSTITLTGVHRFQQGELVTYLTGGGTPIGGLVDGKDYVVILTNDPSRFQLTDPATPNTPVVLTPGVATGDAQGFERASTAVRGDNHIGELVDGETYYVTKVDDKTIRLSDSPFNAVAVLPVNLTAAATTPGSQHTLTLDTPTENPGINITAELEASNSAVTKSIIGGTPSLSQFLSTTVPQDPKNLKAVLFFGGCEISRRRQDRQVQSLGFPGAQSIRARRARSGGFASRAGIGRRSQRHRDDGAIGTGHRRGGRDVRSAAEGCRAQEGVRLGRAGVGLL